MNLKVCKKGKTVLKKRFQATMHEKWLFVRKICEVKLDVNLVKIFLTDEEAK